MAPGALVGEICVLAANQWLTHILIIDPGDRVGRPASAIRSKPPEFSMVRPETVIWSVLVYCGDVERLRHVGFSFQI